MKKIIIIVAILFVVGSVIELGIGNYFYNYAVSNHPKSFIAKAKPLQKKDPNYADLNWFKNQAKKVVWSQESADHLALKADYIDNHANKTVIIAHGYMGSRQEMGLYARLFKQLGYNLLLPDARGHGASEGDYIGYGWPERKDYQGWIKQIIQKNGTNSKIVLFGVSMGAATVMMTSGEQLPSQVKAVIEDCGYTTAKAELTYQQQEMFPKIPPLVSIPVTSLVTRIRAGYFLGQANAVQALKKSKLPTLFIHGGDDHFVPTAMVKELYAAHKQNNQHDQLLIVKGADHAESITKDKTGYYRTVTKFLAALNLSTN
ncbi:alpha/beta hydrolase [Lapidilactobacillus bayanensis]|uniref:alpha/beta hydrolase n=1 Tax=Lapidilactobacillus bayanensis TaxID=2485998 RepID=UPI001CDCBF94|nr:alpha/beta hydrolase [Lapidilactobacillus bayanensis]